MAHRSNFSTLSRVHAPTSFHRGTLSGPSSFHRGATAGPASYSRGAVATSAAVGGSSYSGVKANSTWRLPTSQPGNAQQSSFSLRFWCNPSSAMNSAKRRELPPSVTGRQDSSQNIRGVAVTVEPRNIRQVSEVPNVNNRCVSEQRASLPVSDSDSLNRTTNSSCTKWGPRKVTVNPPQKVKEMQPYRPPSPPDYDLPSNIEEDLRHKLNFLKIQAVQVIPVFNY